MNDNQAANTRSMQAFNAFNSFVRNTITSRLAWLQRLMDPRRDIDAECGHPQIVLITDYKNLFTRGDIAHRIVSLLPDESWSERPEILETEDETETAFETAWQELDEQFGLAGLMLRADVLSGIGRFGVILLGLDDGLPLNEAVAPGEHKLIYIRPFDEGLATVKSLESDVKNPRYGKPKEYQIQFSDTDILSISDSQTKSTTTAQSVHWSRIVHLADNRTNSEVFGTPRLEKVLNRILDVRKIAGGSGEMFWKGGFPGLSIEAAPGLEDRVTFDAEATKEQLEAYMNGLQRYIAMVGMQAKTLSPQIADPAPHVKLQLQLIATAMGIPWRVLVGSEAAQLASEQDTLAWHKRLNRRRKEYITPYIIRPLLDRLIEFGILPEPKELIVNWPDLNTTSDTDKASIAEKRTNALAKYVQSGADQVMPPFHYFTRILGMGDDEAEAIIEEAEKQAKENEDEGLNPDGSDPEVVDANGNPIVDPNADVDELDEPPTAKPKPTAKPTAKR